VPVAAVRGLGHLLVAAARAVPSADGGPARPSRKKDLRPYTKKTIKVFHEKAVRASGNGREEGGAQAG